MRTRSRAFHLEPLEDRTCQSAGASGAASQASRVSPVIPAFTANSYAVYQTDLDTQIAAVTQANVAFYGDSISYNFAYVYGSQVWQQKISPLDAVNYGVAGDMTQNLLWRLKYGNELVHPPKVAVVDIGLNNIEYGLESPGVVLSGIEKVVQTIRSASPSTKILVLGIVPTNGPTSWFRTEENVVNANLFRLYSHGLTIRYLNPGQGYVAPDGSVDAFTVEEFHPNEQGYQVIADAIVPTIVQMLGESRTAVADSLPRGR